MNTDYTEKSVGVIGRFCPPHIGTQQLLGVAFAEYDYVRIGIGSANRGTAELAYSARTPFSVADTRTMLELLIAEGVQEGRIAQKPYDIVPVTDFFGAVDTDGTSLWVKHVQSQFTGIQDMLTGNPYVAELLEPHFNIVNPFVAYDLPQCVRASKVRQAIAIGENWTHLVPHCVGMYISKNGLDSYVQTQFRSELATQKFLDVDTLAQERAQVLGEMQVLPDLSIR